jgi:hypothetical protein
MRRFVKIAVLGLGIAGIAVPAAAQFGGPPPKTGAPLWAYKEGDQYFSTDPILDADLGQGGPGSFTAVIHEADGQLCYIINVPGLADATAAHIHVGAAGQDGAPVVPLAAPKGGSGGGCVAVTADVIHALEANPAGYYVNVHTAAMPMGEVRGQLRMGGKGKV